MMKYIASLRSVSASAVTSCLLICSCGGSSPDAAAADAAGTPPTAQSPSPAPAPLPAPAPTPVSPSLTANAGLDQTVEQLAAVSLDGTASTSPPLASRTYFWRQTAGPAVALVGANTAKPTFVSPSVAAATTLSFALAVSAAGSTATDNVSVTVLRNSLWGAAPSAALSYGPETWAADMANAGITAVRAFDSTKAADRLKPLSDAGMTVTGILQWSPSSPISLPVNDMSGWRKYVGDIVTRYKGRVHHWEVWNEPPNFTADTSPASYGAIVAAAYDAAKAADPTVQIGLAAKSNHVNYLAQSIDAGAANKFDFITLHPYENAELLLQGGEGQFMSIVPRVRTMLQDKNPEKVNVPVWFTEIGLQASPPASSGVSPAIQADGLAKIYTLSAAQGVARVYWFSPRDSEGSNLGLTGADGSKRPSYVAMKTLSTYLGARPNYLGWLQPGASYYGFVFDGPKGTVLSAWARPGQTGSPALLSAVTVVDPRTGATRSTSAVSLTNVPALLVAPADSAQAKAWKSAAAANAGKAFAWYGDHGGAASVSLSAATGPDGVFMISAPAPKLVNGVAEFDLAGRGGVSIAVDPAFMSYTTTPIRISVTLRAQGTGDPGFNLKYESNAALSKTDGNGLVASAEGWHRVSSTSFYEKSWTILNPRFVGFYGYNFMLDTDGPSHSQFSIQKITVSKL